MVGTALDEGTQWRAWVLAAAVGVWGLRLSRHIHQRNGGGEDPRYERLLGGPLDEVGMGVAVRKVFAIQGAAVCLVALPVTIGAVTRRRVDAAGRRRTRPVAGRPRLRGRR